ncbi:MAG: hypothetical protein WA418_35670, partial [Bradyrhizobium sp.]
SIGAPNPGFDNTIVLGFSTDGNPSNDWRIHITPFDNSTVSINGIDKPPFNAPKYWRNSGTWNNSGATTTASTMLDGRVKYSRTGGTGTGGGYWEIEIQIPIAATAASTAGIAFPATGPFKFYANVVSTSFLSGTFTQDPWPAATPIVPAATMDIENSTPSVGGWGTLSFNNRPACNDVSITWADVGVLDPMGGSAIVGSVQAVSDATLNSVGAGTQALCNGISDNHQWPGTQGPLNTFIARPHNGMSSPAQQVSAKFYVANWGIPGVSDWSPIGALRAPTVSPPPVTDNPTPAANISSGGTIDLKAKWSMSVAQSCTYRFSNNGHHCIQVELESTDPATVFSTKSVQRNIDFVSASVNERDAEISVRGRGKVPAGRSQHEILLFVDKAVQYYVKAGGDGRDKEKNFYYRTAPSVKQCPQGLRYPEFRTIPGYSFPQGMTEALVHIVRGYLRKDCSLVINGRRYDCAEAVGSFGVVAGHNGTVRAWRDWIQGNSVKMLEDGVYAVQVPEERSVKVRVTLTAVGRGDKDPGPQKPAPRR